MSTLLKNGVGIWINRVTSDTLICNFSEISASNWAITFSIRFWRSDQDTIKHYQKISINFLSKNFYKFISKNFYTNFYKFISKISIQISIQISIEISIKNSIKISINFYQKISIQISIKNFWLGWLKLAFLTKKSEI